MAIDKAEALQIDQRAADRYASDYIVRLQNEITARGLILNGAIEEFNKFSQLPEKSGLAGAIWDAAFGVLSVAVPALKLAAFIENQYKAAEIAITAAEAFGNKVKAGDRVKKAVTSALQGAAKLSKTGDDVKGAVGKVRELHKASQDVQTLCDHESRKPILDLIVELNNASALWSMVKAAVDAEWILRLDDQKRTGTLEEMMKKFLPPLPKVFNSNELNEVWTYYLYLLIGEFAKRNVKIVTTETVYIYDQGRPNQRFVDTEVVGFNGNQWDQLKAWFGPQAKRGEIFKGRVFTGNRIEFARQLGASPETKKKMVDNGSWRRAKL